MANKINQKYFGNRNIGSSSTTTDDKIGGEGIANITFLVDAGSFAGNAGVAPITVPAIPAPTLPGGVQATYSLTYEVYQVSTGAGKTGLAVGDTFGATSLPGLVAKVTSTSGSNAVFSVLPSDGGSPGNALALADIPQDTVGFILTKIAGSGSASTFNTDVSFHVRTVTITEKGSGYIGTETLPAFTKPGSTNGNVPQGVLVFTTDSGAPGSSTNQENAILAYAKTLAQLAGYSRAQGALRQRLLAGGARDAEGLPIGSLASRRGVHGHSRTRVWGISALSPCALDPHDRRRSRRCVASRSVKDHWTSVFTVQQAPEPQLKKWRGDTDGM